MSTRRAFLERCARLALSVSSVLVLPWAPGCDTRRPGGYRPRERVPTLPIGRSERERPNKITYYLASLTQKQERVVVDMDLMNGMSRGFQACTVWVTLIGPRGEKHRVSYALGPLGPHAQDHVIVKVDGIVFQVDDIDVGVELK